MADKRKPSLLDVDTVEQSHDALVQQAEASLPPPGHERDEALRMRQDELEEAAERLAEETGAIRIDERVFEPDREIRFCLSKQASTIPSALDEYDYKYEFTGNGGLQINAAKSLVVNTSQGPINVGWQIVDRSMAEARGMEEFIDVNGHIRIGDTILMRRLKDRSALEARYQEWVRGRQSGEIEKEVRAMDEDNKRRGRRGIDLVEKDDHIATMQKQYPGRAKSAKRMYAELAAGQQMDKMLREGTVPGM